jgi:hypothetical protein
MAVLDIAESSLQNSRTTRETELPTMWCRLDLLARVTKGQNSSVLWVITKCQDSLAPLCVSCILRSEFLGTFDIQIHFTLERDWFLKQKLPCALHSSMKN